MKDFVSEIHQNENSDIELKNELYHYNALHGLEQKYGSSFYVLDVNKLRENYHKINNAFKSRYSNFIIGYSYKTNYVPYLCKELSKLGAYAEVVSRLEYDLAIKIGENPKKIIFNGPLKMKDDIHYALENESILNIDSLYEIEFIKEYAILCPNKQINVGLRLNFDVSENGVSSIQEGYSRSRFGICIENGSFHSALDELHKIKNVRVVGLHGHFSTSTRSVETYKLKTKKLCKIAKEYILDSLEFINIGGGIYGELPKSFQISAPTFDDYAEAICEVMNHEFATFDKKATLVLEPGVSMVANTFIFVAKVIERKTVTDINYVLVDGSVHNIKPTMHKNNLPCRVIQKKQLDQEKGTYHIVGYTCMEKDYLAHDLTGDLPQKGDYIIFENVGAYTIVFNPPFIKERPAIIAMDLKEIFLIRNKETINQFFNEELYYF
ncbi:diaminopimelate decarboxylase [Bacillus massiliigorillae]|uniref:diaminopimelate decarboxylase n=1 Tax=Bacillus massiliigorillae TaxID=1243664 RepID=UPI0003A731ED|nr:diaminopimelate decarboxylase [Bacillus massiliigorillae]